MKLLVFKVTSMAAPAERIRTQYAKGGATIIQSWFRAGQEIQPGGIWVGAYYIADAASSTADDRLWGAGSVGPDIINPTWRACSWVPC